MSAQLDGLQEVKKLTSLLKPYIINGSMEIKITIEQLESMLCQQKKLVIDKLVGQSSQYNSTNTDGTISPLPIDETKFNQCGLGARFPDEFVTLKKYVR